MGLFKAAALLCSLLVCVSAGGGGYSRGYGGYGHGAPYGGGHDAPYGGEHGAPYGGEHGGVHDSYGYGAGYGHKSYGGDGYHGSGYGGYGYGEHRPKPAMTMSIPHGEPYVNKFAVPKPHPAYGLTHAKKSCIDHYKPGAKNGYYRVFAMHPATTIMVYCDFTSEPGMAYTMVMSSSAAGREAATGVHAVQRSLMVDSPVNAGQPNNVSYRLSQADMKNILGASSVWRLMCTKLTFVDNKPSGHDKTLFDTYIRAKKDDYKLLETDSTASCSKVEYARLPATTTPATPARSCSNCEVPLTQGSDATGYSVHVPTGTAGCTIAEDDDAASDKGTYFGGDSLSAACDGENIYIQLWFGRAY